MNIQVHFKPSSPYARMALAVIITTLIAHSSLLSAQKLDKYFEASEEDKEMKSIDWVYEPYIRTIQLYAKRNTPLDKATTPIIPMHQSHPLILEFDMLGEEEEDLQASLIHCNRDWQQSRLQSAEFLADYNEFPVIDFEFSGSQKVPYLHYKFSVPKVKVSGNYLLKVYRDSDEEDLILIKRFVVYEPIVNIIAQEEVPTGGEDSRRYQQINVTVNFKFIETPTPKDDFFISIRQNNRWDNAIEDLKPRFANDIGKKLQYNYYNLENAFLGLGEFRIFDMSNFLIQGWNVRSVKLDPEVNTVRIIEGISRAGRAYTNLEADMNGRFIIGNNEVLDADVSADYAEVLFSVKTGNPLDEEVHVIGAFNNFIPNEESLMTYNAQGGTYTGSYLLKQGRYDYMFTLIDPKGNRNDRAIENSYQVTRNEYDVIVYHRPMGSRGDRVVGYATVTPYLR